MVQHIHPRLLRSAGLSFATSAVVAAVMGVLLVKPLHLSVAFPIKAVSLLGALALLAAPELIRHPFNYMGPANAVTLARGVLVAFVAAMIGEPVATDLLWLIAPVAMVALAMDGLDGLVARRFRCESPYGARLDMELDALLTLALSVLVWQTGRAGAWVIASGAMRYAFVAAALALPWLNAPLPPRYRRKVVCVVQIGSLTLCLLSFVVPPLSTAIAAIGLVALTGSFGADILWLWRHR